MSSDEAEYDRDSFDYNDYEDYNSDDSVSKPIVADVEIKEDGDNSVIVTWDDDDRDSSGFYSYGVWLSCDGQDFGDEKEVSESPVWFEDLERFKKYSANVEVIDPYDDDDVGFDFDDHNVEQSRWILLGAEQFCAILKELRNYPHALEKMIAQEEDAETLTKMKQILQAILDLEEKIVGLTEDRHLPSEGILNDYKQQLKKWFIEKSPLPPDIQGLQTSVGKEGITVKWDAIAWPSDLQYGVQVYCTQAEHGEVKLVSDSSFLIESPDPTKKFHVEVWSVDDEKTGKRSKSDETMICMSISGIFCQSTNCSNSGFVVACVQWSVT